MIPTVCPDDAALIALLRGAGIGASQDGIESHVGECARCQLRLEHLAGGPAASAIKTAFPSAASSAASPHLHEVMRRMIDPLSGMTPGPSATVRQPQLERYEVQGVIGAGGMGAVFRARDPRLKRPVAIKTLRIAEDDGGLAERFLREAEAIAAIRSDYVVSVYDLGVERGVPFLVMELVEGGSLAEQIDGAGNLAFPRVLKLATEIASALASAHAVGVIHRDVKPRNVLYDRAADRYKLTDFGLVKFQDRPSMTATGAMAGTPEYMSPEQAEGRSLDARSDLFSLGGLLYAACTGASPFQAETAVASIMRVCREAPRPLQRVDPAIPDWFGQLVASLLEKHPSHRPASAGEVLALLARQAAPSASLVRRQTSMKRRALLGSAGVVAFAAIAFAAQMFWPSGATTTTAVTPIRGPLLPFRVGADRRDFASLNDAVNAAASGDVIEIHGNGPFPCLPIALGDKEVTLRGDSDSHPVLVFAPIDVKESKPAISAAGSIALEGLEVRFTQPGPAQDNARSDVLVPTAINVSGRLEITNCIVSVAKRNACVRWSGTSCEIRNSRLSAPDGIGLAWRPRPDAKLALSQNELAAGSCLSVTIDATQIASDSCDIRLDANTFQGDRLFRLRGAGGPKHRFNIVAERNRFEIRRLIVLDWNLRGPKALARPNLAEVKNRLPRFFRWNESKNAYSSSCQFLSHDSTLLREAEIEGAPSDIAGWESFWGVSATGSLLGAIPDADRSLYGANQESVGPGDAWRRRLEELDARKAAGQSNK